MIFCLGEGVLEKQGKGYQKNFMAFNKKVTEERHNEIFDECRKVLKDLKLKLNEEEWSDEWKKVTQEQWLKLSEIPEFDKEVVEGIIGFKLDNDKVEITCEGKSVEISRESAKALNLIK